MDTAYTIVVDEDQFDPDGDGMPNEYEVKNGLDPLVHDALVDTDGDGSTNLEESLFGTGASDPGSRPDLSITLVSPGVVQIRWPSVPDHLYRLEEGATPAGWSEVITLPATQSTTAAQLPRKPGPIFLPGRRNEALKTHPLNPSRRDGLRRDDILERSNHSSTSSNPLRSRFVSPRNSARSVLQHHRVFVARITKRTATCPPTAPRPPPTAP